MATGDDCRFVVVSVVAARSDSLLGLLGVSFLDAVFVVVCDEPLVRSLAAVDVFVEFRFFSSDFFFSFFSRSNRSRSLRMTLSNFSLGLSSSSSYINSDRFRFFFAVEVSSSTSLSETLGRCSVRFGVTAARFTCGERLLSDAVVEAFRIAAAAMERLQMIKRTTRFRANEPLNGAATGDIPLPSPLFRAPFHRANNDCDDSLSESGESSRILKFPNSLCGADVISEVLTVSLESEECSLMNDSPYCTRLLNGCEHTTLTRSHLRFESTTSSTSADLLKQRTRLTGSELRLSNGVMNDDIRRIC